MKILYNKTILIGREPGNNRLMLAIKVADGIKVATIGGAGSVPNSVSRCMPVNNMAHCKLDIDATGNIMLTNMKEENVTYVGNKGVMSNNVNENSTISLGIDKFPISIGEILKKAKEMLKPEEYSIEHLEKVWDEYQSKLQQLQREQKKTNIIKSLYLPLTMVGSGIGALAPSIGLPKESTFIFIGLAACALFYGLYKTITDKSAAKKEQINDGLIDNYTCPNPECKHFMGFQPYKVLKQNKNCPYCKVKFKTE